jgi:hypothetical protein
MPRGRRALARFSFFDSLGEVYSLDAEQCRLKPIREQHKDPMARSAHPTLSSHALACPAFLCLTFGQLSKRVA